MAIDFGKYLTDEQKKQILSNRLAQFASEAYQHTINAQVAQSLDNEEGIENAEKALEILSAAIEAHQAELDILNK